MEPTRRNPVKHFMEHFNRPKVEPDKTKYNRRKKHVDRKNNES